MPLRFLSAPYLKPILSLLTIAFLLLIVWQTDLLNHITLNQLKQNQSLINAYFTKFPFLSIITFSALYITITGLSIPGANILTLGAGAFLGFFKGTIIVLISATIGATIAFLLSRYLFKSTVQKIWGHKFKTIQKGLAKDHAYYLLTLRLIPLFPFFLINLLMGLSSIKLKTYVPITFIGMIAGTMVYVNAGLQISKINNANDVLSLPLFLSFTLLGLLPILTKKAVASFKRKP